MPKIHDITYVQTLATGVEHTVHVDVSMIAMIHAPKTSHSSNGGGAYTYTSFEVLLDCKESFSITCKDTGTHSWAEINKILDPSNEIEIISAMHINRVYEELYEAWAGKPLKKSNKQ